MSKEINESRRFEREGGSSNSKGKGFVENKGERNSWIIAEKFIDKNDKFVFDMKERGMPV